VSNESFFQSPSIKRAAFGLAAVCALVYVAGIVGFISAIHTGDFVVDTLLTGLGAMGCVWAVFRMTRLGVVTTDKGITVRGSLRNDFIAWDLVESFRSGSDIAVGDLTLRELLATPALHSYVVLTDGRHRPLPGLSATRLNRMRSKAQLKEILDQLDAARRSQSR